MRAAWRVAEVRAAEDALMRTLPEGALMARAAAGLARRCAQVLADRFGGRYGRSVLLLVGPGNNGGDALYAGAALARRGALVRAVATVPDRVHAGGTAALRAAGGRFVTEVPDVVDLVVDGILGIGGRGGLRGAAAGLVDAAAEATASDLARPPVVAVDLPSGVDADTGEVPGAAVRADLTVTFGVLKPGLLVGAGAVRSGPVELVDIGLRPWLSGQPALLVPDLPDVAGWWPRPAADDDKYSRGVVGVATGSNTYPGAAVLSTAGALAGPAGMVRYAGPAADAVRSRHPSVIATARVVDAGRVQAWVCGCGLGTDERAREELSAVLAAPVPICLDADALSLLAGGSQRTWLAGGSQRTGLADGSQRTGLADGSQRTGLADGSLWPALVDRTAPTVLTPHDREFARLYGREPGADRVASACRLAAQLGVVVLLKGDRTVVAGPDGAAMVNPTGTPALATAGTGDVLAGLLGSLLAAGVPADRAAVAAAYAHGLAGRLAAEKGPVTAAGVAAALPTAIGRALTAPG